MAWFGDVHHDRITVLILREIGFHRIERRSIRQLGGAAERVVVQRRSCLVQSPCGVAGWFNMRGLGVGLSTTPCINCGPGAPRSTDGTLYEWYCGMSGEVQFTGITPDGSDATVAAEPKPVSSPVVCSALSSGAVLGAPAKRPTEPS